MGLDGLGVYVPTFVTVNCKFWCKAIVNSA